ncbi:hypothetical protein DFH28DRAFT_899214, partial [Melampsora americana]
NSPMHKEISNTPHLSMTLNPCRICDSSVESQAKRHSETYIWEFLGISADGLVVSSKKFSDLSKKYGIKDSMNLKFIEQVRAMPTTTRQNCQDIVD